MNNGTGIKVVDQRFRRGNKLEARVIQAFADNTRIRRETQAARKSAVATAARTCIAWKPSFREDSGTHYVKFRLGLLNQIAATNWNDEHAIADDATKWAVLNVTASNGRITGYTIALDDATPTEDQIAEDFPPDEFKIVLGVIDSLRATMAACENLEASGIETFRQSRTPPAAGAEPFTRWWRWKVNQNTEGEYPFIT